jgi:hypothetical protein
MKEGRKEEENSPGEKEEEKLEVQVEMQKGDPKSTSSLKLIAESVSKKMTSLINGNFVRPYTSSLVDKGIGGLTAGLNASIEEQMKGFKAERRTEFNQNNDPDNRLPDEYKEAHKDEKVMQTVNEEIENFANDEKVGLQHLGSVSEAFGVPIKVLDENGNLVRIIGDTSGGKVPVEVRYEDGHYTLPNGNDPPGGSTKPNDCIYNVIADQLVKSDPEKFAALKDPENVAAMRGKTVEKMRQNRDTMAHQYADVQYLKENNRKVLHEGGIVKPKNKKVKKFLKGKEKLAQGAGSWKEFDDNLKGRYGLLEINHIPPDSCTEGDKNDKLCIAMDYEDHRNSLSTTNPAYREALSDMISKDKENGFANALLVDCLDTHLTSLKSGNGEYQAKEITAKIDNFPKSIENFTPEYLKTHEKSFEKGEKAFKLIEGKISDAIPSIKPKTERTAMTLKTQEKREEQKRLRKNEIARESYKRRKMEKENREE